VGSPASGVFQAIYRVFDLNVQVESTAWDTVITGKGKTKRPSAPRAPRGLPFLNTHQRRLNSAVARATLEYSPTIPWVENHG
jgi:hypothetical protein